MKTEALSRWELANLATRMHAVAERVYWLFFKAGMGAEVHAFLEFNGLIAKYVEICQRCADEGIDFTQFNTHTGAALPVEVHDMEYLGEKLACIFGPILAANREAREALKNALFGAEQPASPSDERLLWLCDKLEPSVFMSGESAHSVLRAARESVTLRAELDAANAKLRELQAGADAAAFANAYFHAVARVEQLEERDITSLLAKCQGKPTLREENAALCAEVTRLREALTGLRPAHRPTCESVKLQGFACGCGAAAKNARIDELLAATERTP